MDPGLVFRLLVVADGFVPAESPRPADPLGGSVSFTLTGHDFDRRDPARVFRGRVLDEDGKPVARATVQPFGFMKGGRGRFGALRGLGFDALAVTDDKGAFRLGIPEGGVDLFVRDWAPLLATRVFQRLPTDGKARDLTLLHGVTVRGRLVKGGKPLAGGAVGLVQKDRSSHAFVGPFQAATNEAGVFTIPNLPPDDVMFLYGLMDSLRSHGAVAVRELRTGKSGTEVDVGDVEVKPGYRLSGRVELADGKAVPAGTRVSLSREDAWDYQVTVIGKGGAFAFEGLPAERYYLSARVPGYHVSAENKSLDLLSSGGSLVGMVRGDIQGLRLLLAPGPEPARLPMALGGSENAPKPSPAEWKKRMAIERERFAEGQRRRDAPLQGAPATPAKK